MTAAISDFNNVVNNIIDRRARAEKQRKALAKANKRK